MCIESTDVCMLNVAKYTLCDMTLLFKRRIHTQLSYGNLPLFFIHSVVLLSHHRSTVHICGKYLICGYAPYFKV